MGAGQEIEVITVGFMSDQAYRAFSEIAFPPHLSAGHLRDQVAAGAMVLRQAHFEGEPVAWAVYWLDGGDLGTELVIADCVGRLPGAAGSLIDALWMDWERIAAANDCASIRIHSRRKGMLKKLAGVGFRFREFVLEKEVA